MNSLRSCCIFLLFLTSSHLLVSAQNVCDNYLRGNELNVDTELLDELDSERVDLQEVVDCVDDGGRLVFDIPTLELESLRITSMINISGTARSTSVSCNGGPIFIINATDVWMSDLEISSCTLDDENAPVVIAERASLQLNSVRFENNRNRLGSAAVRMRQGSSAVIEDCSFVKNNGATAHVIEADPGSSITIQRSVFRRNRGSGSTLAINHSSSINISSSQFVSNEADIGGAVLRVETEEGETSVEIRDSEFASNEARNEEGGAIFIRGFIFLSILDDCVFAKNNATLQGGAIFILGSSIVEVEDSYFSENESAFIGGGAVFLENSNSRELNVTVSNTVFSGNSAKNELGSGGAIRLQGAGVNCTVGRGSSFVSNRAELDGGAIHVSAGPTVTVSNASFVGNEVYRGGAAALFAVSDMGADGTVVPMQLRIASSIFLFNQALIGPRGGGVLGFAGFGTEVEIDYCKFQGSETVHGSGGVIYLFDGPSVTVRNCIFSNNKAIWGGAVYAEKEGSYNLTYSSFSRNAAQRGGALDNEGAIATNVMNCVFELNSAKEEGGAVRAVNYVSSGGDTGRITFRNSRLLSNNVGYDLAENAINGEVTRGGGVLIVGSGMLIDVLQTEFYNNSGVSGGALGLVAMRECAISEQSSFRNNSATFGGAISFSIDHFVDIHSDRYRIIDAEFRENGATSDGGAIRVSSEHVDNDIFPTAVTENTLELYNCSFQRNRALRVGGGIAIEGVGALLQNVSFQNNSAESVLDLHLAGSGGALAIMDGASVGTENATFLFNEATFTGAAMFVMDSSTAVGYTNFINNSVTRSDGKGGAVALRLAADRQISDYEGGTQPRPILFQCNHCKFIRNSAPAEGGAIFSYHSNSTANYSEIWTCGAEWQRQYNIVRGQEDQTSLCQWVDQVRRNLEARVIRIFNTTFEGNEAQGGAAIFTNHPRMLTLASIDTGDDGVPIGDAVRNRTIFEERNVSFTENKVADDGYGNEYASYPVIAILTNEENANGSSNLAFDQFRSGDRLRFDIKFKDAFGQNVTVLNEFVALLEYVGDDESHGFEISGQESGRMDDGKISFTGTKVVGDSNLPHKLKLRFRLAGQDLMLDEEASVTVTIRPCRIGEYSRQDGDFIECIKCSRGQFNYNPEATRCQSCQDVVDGQCFGHVVIPDDRYWHASSFSLKMFQCVGRDSCRFENRTARISVKESEAHLRSVSLVYDNDSTVQCRDGYQGILCGSCAPGYGREGDKCTQCASEGLRCFVLTLLLLWSISFLAYFLRSVLQLSKRIEFNKRFGSNLMSSRNAEPAETITGPELQLERISEEEISADSQGHISVDVDEALQETNTFPVPGDRLVAQPSRRDIAMMVASELRLERQRTLTDRSARSSTTGGNTMRKQRTLLAKKIQMMRNNPGSQIIQPLTLANPVSEVLKVMINFLQVSSLAVSINCDWTNAVRNTLILFGALGNLASGTGYFSLDCFLNSDTVPKSIKRMTLNVLYPLLLFILFTLMWWWLTIARKKTKEYFTRRILFSFLAIIYFFYIGLTKNLLRFFACADLKEDDGVEKTGSKHFHEDSYWEEDTSIQCYSQHHALLVGVLVIPLLCAVSTGFPLGVLFIIQSNANRLDDDDFIGTYGFLYRAYDKPYWEIIIMMRKGLIATVAVFGYLLGENIQGLLCILILGISLGLHLTYHPFSKDMPRLNSLETCSLSTTIIVFASGLLFNDPNTDRVSRIIVSLVAILFVVCTLLWILFELIASGEEVIDMLLLEHDIMSCDELCEARLSSKLEKLFMYYVARGWNVGHHIALAVPMKRKAVPTHSPTIQMGNTSSNPVL